MNNPVAFDAFSRRFKGLESALRVSNNLICSLVLIEDVLSGILDIPVQKFNILWHVIYHAGVELFFYFWSGRP